jgi:hypothetical protein
VAYGVISSPTMVVDEDVDEESSCNWSPRQCPVSERLGLSNLVEYHGPCERLTSCRIQEPTPKRE